MAPLTSLLTASRRATQPGLAAALLACAVLAQAEDLPGTAGCRAALQALAEAEDALMAAPGAASAADAQDDSHRRSVGVRLLPLRQRVADACLGGMTTSPSPAQHTGVGLQPGARAPLSAPPMRMPQTAVPVVTVPSPRIDPPVSINHCTGMTCLASDGSTLTRVGPSTLVSPRGVCTLQAGVVRCP